MNKIYKVVWSKLKNSYVVVSEIAKRNGKCSSSLNLNKKIIAAFLAAGTVLSVTGIASAETLEDTYIKIKSTGTAASAEGNDAISIGLNANASTTNAIALGVNAVVNGNMNTTNEYLEDSIAVGHKASAYGGRVIAIGPEASVGNANNLIENAIAIGYAATAQDKSAIAIGDRATANGEQSVAVGGTGSGETSGALTEGSTAIGFGAVAGNSSNISGTTQATAVGHSAKATGKESSAFGFQAEAKAEQSTALGRTSKAYTSSSTAVGGGAIAGDSSNISDTTQATAVGHSAQAKGKDSSAFGYGAKATAKQSTALGTGSQAATEGSTAVGLGAVAGNGSNTYATATGHSAQAKGKESSAFGYKATATAARSIAIGSTTSATVEDGIALGSYSVAGVAKGIYGYDPATGKKSTNNTVTWRSTKGAVSVGNSKDTRQITNVAAGLEDTDAVNVAQLKAGRVELEEGTNITLGTKYDPDDGHMIYTINAAGGGDAIHFYSVNSSDETAGNYDNKGATGDNALAAGVDASADGANSIAIGTKANATVDDTIAIGNNASASKANSVALGSNSSMTEIGGMTQLVLNGKTYTFAGTPSVNNGTVSIGSAGKERTILNVAPGRISAASTDAINGSQLYAALDAMQFDIVAGDNVEVIKETSNGHTKYTIHSLNAIVEKGTNTGVVPDTPETTDTTNGNTTDLTGETTSEPTPTASETPIEPGSDNNHTTTYTVNAADSKVDSIKIEKGESKTTGSTTETEYTVTVKSNEQSVGEDGNIVTTPVDKTTSFTVTDLDTRNKIVAGDNIEVTASGDDETGPVTYTISAKAATYVKVTEGEHTTVTQGKDGDFTTYAVNVLTDGKVASGDDGIVTGDTIYRETRVEKDGNYIKKDNTAAENITALDEKVKDNATNIENINNSINNTYNQMNRLDDRMKKGLAGAAALAALHPMDFNPDDKMQFSAGVGNYRGETAAALGMFYRPDESVMFSIGGTFGNSDNMVNAGITFGLDGTRNRITRSRTAMAHEIVELRDHIAKQDQQIARLTNLVNKLVGPEQRLENPSMFPDVPENHWAYQYVEDLQKRGIIEGYPDGNFAGSRSMTRYEFAAMLDRALQKGVKLDADIAKEFEAELGRIYVERIAGQDNDRKKIERVRVNNSDSKYPEGKTRDVYGSKIVTTVSKTAEVK